MNSRAYLNLLRPWRTLPFGVVYGWAYGMVMLSLFGRTSVEEALMLTAAFIAPLGLGELLFTPIREVISRSFFPLLGDSIAQLRRWHLRTLVTAAAVQYTVAWFLAPGMPRSALFGLVTAGLCLPMLGRRSTTGTALQLLIILPLLSPTARSVLLHICEVAPWTATLACLGGALLCVRRAFSADVLLELRQARTAARNQTTGPSRRLDCSSPVQPIGSNTRDWMRAVHHARFGALSRAWVTLGAVLLGAIPVIAMTTIPFLLGLLAQSGTGTLTLFCNQIVDSSLARLGRSSSPLFLFNAFPFFAVFMAQFVSTVPVFPTSRLPIARHSLATSIFLETLRLGGLGWIGYVAASCATVAGAALFTARPIEAGFFVRPLASALVLPAVIFFELALLYAVAQRRWPSSYGIYLLWLFGGAFFGAFGLYLADSLTSLVGLTVWFPGTAFATWLFWRAVSRYYRISDLARPIPWARFSFAKTG